MPNLGELIVELIGSIGTAISTTQLRLAPGPALALGLIALVFLSLIARPSSRWAARDLGRLASLRHAVALAAESGDGIWVSLGSAGVSRATGAAERLQTLAGLAVLGHAARLAARAGVPLRISTNDPVAGLLADDALDQAHREADTQHQRQQSVASFDGEGRPAAGGTAMAQAMRPGVVIVAGSLGEEALLLQAPGNEAAWSSLGSASPSQLAGLLMTSGGSLLGAELFGATSDLRPGNPQRIAVHAANRLLGVVVLVLIAGTVLAVSGAGDLKPFLVGG